MIIFFFVYHYIKVSVFIINTFLKKERKAVKFNENENKCVAYKLASFDYKFIYEQTFIFMSNYPFSNVPTYIFTLRI